MASALTSIPGWQVYLWILAISLPAAIHLRAGRYRDRSRRSEVVLMYVLGVSGAIGMFNVVTHTVFARRRRGVDRLAGRQPVPDGGWLRQPRDRDRRLRLLLALRLLAPGRHREVGVRLGCRPDPCAGHRPDGKPGVEQRRPDPGLGLPPAGRDRSRSTSWPDRRAIVLPSRPPCTGRRDGDWRQMMGSRSRSVGFLAVRAGAIVATRDEPTDENGAVTDRPADGTRWMRYVWLVYLGALFFQPAFDPTAGPLDWVAAVRLDRRLPAALRRGPPGRRRPAAAVDRRQRWPRSAWPAR